MVFHKIDNRIRLLIENGVENCHRSLFVIVGDKAKEQVATIYNILAKAQIKSRPTVLWCYKNELSFSRNRQKRLKHIQKKHDLGIHETSNNIFDSFIESSKIRFAYYKDSKKILGNTFGMLVLQDFEALTPNIMARTIETVEGGGVICLLLSSITSLRQLYTISMDVHARYRTEAFQDVACRFNERFLLSLNDCNSCAVLDDKLNILPIFSNNLIVEKIRKRTDDHASPNQKRLAEICESLNDTQPIGSLLKCCKTFDQANVLCAAFEIVSHLKHQGVVSMTAARGRGKSAALGLLIAGAISIGVSNIYVIAPSPNNLVTLFEFILKGLQILAYSEKNDFELLYSNVENQKLITGIKVTRTHRQNIQYVPPDAGKIYNPEIIVCDEAAAIPLPMVKKLIGPHLLILSSTVNGYEGTGRSLSLKLIKELRENSASRPIANQPPTDLTYTPLTELSLSESIRYSDKDPVELWLNKLLCLDDTNAKITDEALLCSAKDCRLYYVSRDTLFSYHKAAEMFLQNLVSLYVASHYKNSPNDLQMMADSPAHNIFVLLSSEKPPKNTLPQIFCVIQVCFEGGISGSTVKQNVSRGQRASGDLIPWTVSQQFCETDFASLRGMRIVRIATHPEYTQMGYGTRAMQLLINYFGSAKDVQSDDRTNDHHVQTKDDLAMEETLEPRSGLPPLLINIEERPAEKLDYMGVSYGLTPRLLKFWKRLGFIPVYLRQTPNELTGEFTNIMLRSFKIEREFNEKCLFEYYSDFRSRLLSLLAYTFKDLSPSLALSLMYHDAIDQTLTSLSNEDLERLLTPHDMKRLESYANNMVDFHFIMDLVPTISKLFFTNRIGHHQNNWFQMSIILSLGLQHNTVESVEKSMNVPMTQILATFNKFVRKTVAQLNRIKESALSRQDYNQRDSNENGSALSNSRSCPPASKDTFDHALESALKSSKNPSSISVLRPEKRKASKAL